MKETCWYNYGKPRYSCQGLYYYNTKGLFCSTQYNNTILDAQNLCSILAEIVSL